MQTVTSEHALTVGICGSFQTGKSALVNCLLGRPVAAQGFGMATTALPTTYSWGTGERVQLLDPDGTAIRFWRTIERFQAEAKQLDLRQRGSLVMTLPCPLLRAVTLVDTPGFDANQVDNTALEHALQSLDYILFLQGNQKELREEEARWIRCIADRGKPFSIIINCNENVLDHEGNAWWNPAEPRNCSLQAQVHSALRRLNVCPIPIAAQDVLLCNVLWHLCGIGLLRQEETEGRRWFSRLRAHFDGRLPTPDELARQSGVGLIKEFLIAENWRAVSAQKVHCVARVHQSLSDWQNRLTSSIEAMEAALSRATAASGLPLQ